MRWSLTRRALFAGIALAAALSGCKAVGPDFDLMVDAPTPVSEQQMRELHLKISGRS